MNHNLDTWVVITILLQRLQAIIQSLDKNSAIVEVRVTDRELAQAPDFLLERDEKTHSWILRLTK